jgi:hypothetical protein
MTCDGFELASQCQPDELMTHIRVDDVHPLSDSSWPNPSWYTNNLATEQGPFRLNFQRLRRGLVP